VSEVGYVLTEYGVKRAKEVFQVVFQKIGKPLRPRKGTIEISGNKIEELKKNIEVEQLNLKLNTKEKLSAIMQRSPQINQERTPKFITNEDLEQFLRATKKLADHYQISFQWETENFIQTIPLNQQQIRRLNIAEEKNSKTELAQKLKEAFYLFNYSREIALFEDIYAQNQPAVCFYISGSSSHGQKWLGTRLIEKHLPSSDLKTVNLHLTPKFIGLEKQLLNQLELWEQTSLSATIKYLAELYIKQRLRCVITLNITNLNYASTIYKNIFNQFFNQFWLPLLEISRKLNEESVVYLLIINDEGIKLNDSLDDPSYQKANEIIHFNLKEDFTYQNISSWLSRSKLPEDKKTQIKAMFAEYKTQTIKPLEAFEMICEKFELNFYLDILNTGVIENE